jgi:hypothetical protein
MKRFKSVAVLLAFTMISTITFAQNVNDIITKHLEAIGGKDNWNKVNTLHMEATLSAQGMDIPIIVNQIHNKAAKQEFTVMGSTGYSVVTSEGAWAFNPMAGQSKAEPLPEEQATAAKAQLDIRGEFLNYAEKGSTVELQGSEDIDGTPCYKIKLTQKDGKIVNVFIDSKTFYKVRQATTANVNGQDVEVVVSYSNYQKIANAGIVMPFSIENTGMPAPLTFTKIEVNGKIDEAIFKVN